MIADAERKGLLHEDSIRKPRHRLGTHRRCTRLSDNYHYAGLCQRRNAASWFVITGAEVILIHDDGDIGACIDECLQTALRMAKEDPHVFVPQQFANPANADIQRRGHAQAILEQVSGPIDGFCSGVGTGGTITGIGEATARSSIRT